MADFNLWLLLLVVPVMALAGWIHGALGLGFPMVATPLIAVFVDVKIAILLTLLPTATVNVASVVSAKNVKTAFVKYQSLIFGTLVGGVIGSMILARTEPEPFRLLLAALIMLFLVTNHFNLRLPVAASTAVLLVFGFCAGIAGGTTNVMVAVLIIYFLSANVQRGEMVPAMNMCFLVGKLTQIVVFLIVGVINILWLVYTVPLAAVSLGALKIGQRHGAGVDVERYRQYLQLILLVLAIVLVFQYFNGLR